jgi:hypothetical protein
VGNNLGFHFHHLEAPINILELLEKNISMGNQVGGMSSSTIQIMFCKKWYDMMNVNP